MTYPPPTLKEAAAEIAYDPIDGKFSRITPTRKKAIGEDATMGSGNGYHFLLVKGKNVLAHRIAWLLIHGEYPPLGTAIDHINGIPTDNRLENIRIATQSQNCQNKRAGKNSKSGIKGVSFSFERRKWCAFIGLPTGKNKILGRFNSMDEAVAAYRRAAVQLFGEFARP